jgi:ATP-dependent exoDNAse (exonuclease V) alpha subunit
MTVHKSQGSQYDKLIVLLDEAEWMRREESALWYTAYTRGSKTVKTVLGRKYKRRRDRVRR